MNIELYVAPLRAVVESKLQAFLEYESGGLAASMLIGTRMDSDQSLYAHAKVIGIFDIFSVSGMHVSNLWSITSSLSAFVLKGKRMVTIVSLTILILYMLFVGFQLPIIRAVVMRVVSVLVAQTTGRFLSPALVLLVLCVCYYCTDKSVFTKISFQFSYLVTFLLVAFGSSSLMQNRHLRIERLRVNSLVQDVQQFALQSWRTSLLAQAGAIPLSLFHFGYWTPLGILISPLFGILANLVYSGTLLFVILEFIPFFSVVSTYFGVHLYSLISVFEYLVSFFAQFDSLFISIKPTVLQAGIAGFLVLMFYLSLKKENRVFSVL